MKKMLLAVAMTVMLCGCQSAREAINVLGSCELPPSLNQKDQVDPLDDSHDIPQDQANVLWAKDRSHLAKAVKHGNDTIDWVAGHC